MPVTTRSMTRAAAAAAAIAERDMIFKKKYPTYVNEDVKVNMKEKACGHSCYLDVTEKCCMCEDKRPTYEMYESYEDGVGFVANKRRWDGYCPCCRDEMAGKIEVGGRKTDKSLRVSEMPVVTRSMRRAMIAERDERNAAFMKKVVDSVPVPVPVPAPAPAPVPAPAPAKNTEFEAYKEIVKQLFDEHAKCNDTDVKAKLYDVLMEYLVQPDMLKKASTQWLVTWRASVIFHINHTKSASSLALGKDVIATLDGYLESEGHYKVTTKRFIEIYDWIIDFATKGNKDMNVYATSLVAYMNRALPGVWGELELKKKSAIRARVMMWKEMEAPTGYLLVERCNEFLEKYKMI